MLRKTNRKFLRSAHAYIKIYHSPIQHPRKSFPVETFTVIRPVGSNFPIGFDGQVKTRAKGLVKLVKQEQEILNFFLAKLNVVDPDVLVGHQLEGVDFSILLSRFQAKKTHQWSRIGRMRRTQWPSSMGKIGGTSLRNVPCLQDAFCVIWPTMLAKFDNDEMYFVESYRDVQSVPRRNNSTRL